MTQDDEAHRLFETRKSVKYRLATIRPGELFQFDDFFLFRHGGTVGAAIPAGDELPGIHNVHPGRSYSLDGDNALPGAPGNFLVLSVDADETDLADEVKREDFADRILSFASRENGAREALLRDPWGWAERIIEMTGNAASELRPYPYLAEVLLLNRLRAAGLVRDPAAEYRGPDAALHDFELSSCSIECKSHLHAKDGFDGEITVTNQHQLAPTGGKPLYLCYFAMEDAGDLTVEAAARDFGEPRAVLLEKLRKCRIVEGDFAWRRPYHLVCEPLVYEIDGAFPRITPALFPGGRFPAGIVSLQYRVSLQNLPRCTLSSFIDALAAGRNPKFAQ